MKYFLVSIAVLGFVVSSAVEAQYYISWADTIDNGPWDWALGVAVDGLDNIIVTGCSEIGAYYDYFTVKYNPSGIILWADTIDNGDMDGATAVVVDGSDNIIVTGYSKIGGYSDYFTVKYDPSGVILWADTIDNGDMDGATAVVVDGSDNIIVTGYSKIGGYSDYFTVKYDPSGVILWADTIDNGARDNAYGVAVDTSDNIIVTGVSWIGGDADYFTVKYVPSTGIEDTETGFMTSLCEIYPNPLTSDANIRFTASKKTGVKLGVYDVSGRLIQTIIDNVMDTGEYIISWVSLSLPSGVYFLKLKAGAYSDIRRAVILR